MSSGKVQVFDAVVDFSVTPLDTVNWVPVGNTIGQDFVKLKIADPTNSEMEIGYGAPNQTSPYVAQRAFRMNPGGGDYPQIFNKNMQMFVRLIMGSGGATSLTQGRMVLNGFY
jgi:hypothetical protein